MEQTLSKIITPAFADRLISSFNSACALRFFIISKKEVIGGRVAEIYAKLPIISLISDAANSRRPFIPFIFPASCGLAHIAVKIDDALCAVTDPFFHEGEKVSRDFLKSYGEKYGLSADMFADFAMKQAYLSGEKTDKAAALLAQAAVFISEIVSNGNTADLERENRVRVNKAFSAVSKFLPDTMGVKDIAPALGEIAEIFNCKSAVLYKFDGENFIFISGSNTQGTNFLEVADIKETALKAVKENGISAHSNELGHFIFLPVRTDNFKGMFAFGFPPVKTTFSGWEISFFEHLRKTFIHSIKHAQLKNKFHRVKRNFRAASDAVRGGFFIVNNQREITYAKFPEGEFQNYEGISSSKLRQLLKDKTESVISAVPDCPSAVLHNQFTESGEGGDMLFSASSRYADGKKFLFAGVTVEKAKKTEQRCAETVSAEPLNPREILEGALIERRNLINALNITASYFVSKETPLRILGKEDDFCRICSAVIDELCAGNLTQRLTVSLDIISNTPDKKPMLRILGKNFLPETAVVSMKTGFDTDIYPVPRSLAAAKDCAKKGGGNLVCNFLEDGGKIITALVSAETDESAGILDEKPLLGKTAFITGRDEAANIILKDCISDAGVVVTSVFDSAEKALHFTALNYRPDFVLFTTPDREKEFTVKLFAKNFPDIVCVDCAGARKSAISNVVIERPFIKSEISGILAREIKTARAY